MIFNLAAGFGLFGGLDLGDRFSETTRFAGGGLSIPVRLEIHDAVRLRATLRAEMGWGTDRLTWSEEVAGETVRVFDDDHSAILASGALSVGADILLPLGLPIGLYFGAEAGPAWFGTYHVLGGDTVVLLDPEQNDLERPTNVDPYTSQGALLSDVHFGVERVLVEDRLALWFEVGYSIAFVESRGLRKSPAELDAKREAYGYNALRAGVGFWLWL